MILKFVAVYYLDKTAYIKERKFEPSVGIVWQVEPLKIPRVTLAITERKDKSANRYLPLMKYKF